jgi:hypothetical protein
LSPDFLSKKNLTSGFRDFYLSYFFLSSSKSISKATGLPCGQVREYSKTASLSNLFISNIDNLLPNFIVIALLALH